MNPTPIDNPVVEYWPIIDGHLVREVEAPDFPTAIAWVVAIADLAEQMDHHPDIDIRWRRFTLRLRTHSADALTDLDVKLAEEINDFLRSAR
jgi:4a-hydroxytetrahydrobiopterin dehydratase